MKLKTFNQSKSSSSKKGPKISAYFKNGVFLVNAAAASLIGLKEGDFVSLHQDEDAPADWYLEIHQSEGLSVRKRLNYYMFNSCSAIQEMMASNNWEGKGMNCRIGMEPTEVDGRKLWSIITRGAVIRQPKSK